MALNAMRDGIKTFGLTTPMMKKTRSNDPQVFRDVTDRPAAILGTIMSDSKLAIEEREEGDVTVLTLTGEITLDDGDLAFRRRVHDLIDRGRAKLVVDLAGVMFIDSAGVGMLAAKLKTVRERGGDLRLSRLSNRGQRLLGMMKILVAFETFDDEASAVASYGWPR